MTRADINYIYQETGSMPKVLYLYHNGDQYPRGLRDFYNVLDFINSDWSKEAFIKWIGDNYTDEERVTASNDKGMVLEYGRSSDRKSIPLEKTHKIIDDYTDYGYVFSTLLGINRVTVYSWGEKIFSGEPEEFKKWIKKQK